MALISCPQCGKSISDTASVCPHCGLDLKAELRKRENEREYSRMSKEKQTELRREYDKSFPEYALYEQKMKKRKRLGYIMLAICFLGFVLTGVMIYKVFSTNDEYNTSLDSYYEAVNAYNSAADQYYSIKNNPYSSETELVQLEEQMEHWKVEIDERGEIFDNLSASRIGYLIVALVGVALSTPTVYVWLWTATCHQMKKHIRIRLTYLKQFQLWLEREKQITYHFTLTGRERKIYEDIDSINGGKK